MYMNRLHPYLRMVLRTTAFGLALGVLHFALHFLPWFGQAPSLSYFLSLPAHLLQHLALGLTAGVAMAIVTHIAYRQIRKPALYRFAMLIVAMIVGLVFFADPGFYIVSINPRSWTLEIWLDLVRNDPWLAVAMAHVLATYIAMGACGVFVAGKYLRDIEPMKLGTENSAK